MRRRCEGEGAKRRRWRNEEIVEERGGMRNEEVE